MGFDGRHCGAELEIETISVLSNDDPKPETPITDKDAAGNEWPLEKDALVFGRSMPLYTDLHLQKKRDEFSAILQDMQAARERQMTHARKLTDDNKACEQDLIAAAGLPPNSDPTMLAGRVTDSMIEKIKPAGRLHTFSC